MDAHTLSVAQLNRWISDALEGAFPEQVWVRGEIHGMQRSTTGHTYFRLVEPGTLGRPTEASASVVLFRGNRVTVDHLLARAGGIALTDGLDVRIRGEVQFYAPQGRIQLRMTGIDPTHTLGQLAADRDQLLQALAAEGLLDRNRRLPFPTLPLRVGVVTSAASAAAADALHQFKRASCGWELTIIDTRVQGAGSAEHVAAALSVAARLPLDVVIVVRGGGSRTDLVTFDSEIVARTIASMPVPVLTGIGHEIDDSVADRVAFRSFTTPTACAAFVCEVVAQARTRCEDLTRRLARCGVDALDRADARVHAASARIRSGARTTVELAAARVDRHAAVVASRPTRAIERADQQLDALERHVRALDPARVIARGWSITRTADGTLVRRIDDAPPGTEVHTTVSDGTLVGTVSRTDPRPTDSSEPPADD